MNDENNTLYRDVDIRAENENRIQQANLSKKKHCKLQYSPEYLIRTSAAVRPNSYFVQMNGSESIDGKYVRPFDSFSKPFMPNKKIGNNFEYK